MTPDTTFSLSVLIAILGCFAKLDMAIGLRKDHDELEEKHNSNTERIGRVEESTKAAHRRIDTLEQKIK